MRGFFITMLKYYFQRLSLLDIFTFSNFDHAKFIICAMMHSAVYLSAYI
jgi:hypothetical protein